MRAFQFWILILASTVISGLMIKQIFLTRDLNQLQRTLVESQQVISEGSEYHNAWQKLAMSIYQASRQDPTLDAVLKSEKVEVRATKPPGPGTAVPPTAPAPSTAAKAPVAPPHPTTP